MHKYRLFKNWNKIHYSRKLKSFGDFKSTYYTCRFGNIKGILKQRYNGFGCCNSCKDNFTVKTYSGEIDDLFDKINDKLLR